MCILFSQTNYSFGYGFVNFVSEEGALQAIKTLNGITLRNKRLKVYTLFSVFFLGVMEASTGLIKLIYPSIRFHMLDPLAKTSKRQIYMLRIYHALLTRR